MLAHGQTPANHSADMTRKHGITILLLLITIHVKHSSSSICTSRNVLNFTVKMPGITPDEAEVNFCTGVHIELSNIFIANFTAVPSHEGASQMLIFGCEDPLFEKENER